MVLSQLEDECEKIKCQTTYSGDGVVLWIYIFVLKIIFLIIFNFVDLNTWILLIYTCTVAFNSRIIVKVYLDLI